MSFSKRLVSGIQPSGGIHIGNYLGAILQWKNSISNYSRKEDILYFIADYHSITTILNDNNIKQRKSTTLNTLATLIACGIDPNKCTLFLQSSVPQHTELQWILSCVTPHSWLNTMIQYKEKNIDSNGLYSYPLLMASDVLLYKATEVPVGIDQTQHLELIKKTAQRINKVILKDLFPTPKPIISFSKVMSLTDGTKKMSKSDKGEEASKSIIYLKDKPEEITTKIIKSKTDSISTIKNDPSRKEIYNLINIYSSFSGLNLTEIEEKYTDKNLYTFKQDLSDLLCKELNPIREKTEKLLKHEEDYLLDILNEGKKTASIIAIQTMEEIKQLLNFVNI